MTLSSEEKISFLCPECQRKLRIANSLRGRKLRCPRCKKVISTPAPENQENAEELEFPDWMVVFCGVAFLLVTGGLLSFVIGTSVSIVSCSLVGGLAFLVWKRKEFFNRYDQWQRQAQQIRAEKKQQPRTSHSSPRDSTPPSKESVSMDSLFELQTAESARPRVESGKKRQSTTESVTRWFRGTSVEDVRFFGPDSLANVDGHQLTEPMIYLVEGTLQEPFDASLIETGLPVAKTARGTNQLPYWPNYRGCSPDQRRVYLNWLSEGRRDPGVELGYVFIYFYGLERRVVLDRSDFISIVEELLELLPIYDYSRSFQRYCSSLLWMTLICAAEVNALPGPIIERVIESTQYWNEDNIAALLSLYAIQGAPLPSDIAFLVTEHDPRSPRSVVIKRHPEKFRELFVTRYSQQFNQGLQLKTSKREYAFNYRPASESLMYVGSDSSRIRVNLPNVLGIPSQFKPLIEIWNSAIEDLKAFDRIHKKTTSERSITADMYEALPVELREEDHPDFERWYQIINQHTSEAGWAFVPLGELAKARGIAERTRLTKKQSEQLLAAADSMDLCLEPDARETGQNYQWKEFVSVYPREYEGVENLKSYHAASILLRLGMTIAAADGQVDDCEVSLITEHLEQQFELSNQESVRLEHLAALLRLHPRDDSQLGRKLQRLPEHERGIIGDLLVGIAAADEVITSDEVKVLRKSFRNLDLNTDRIDRLAVGQISVVDDPDTEAELVLDHRRIRDIMSETSQVSEFLQNVMLDDEIEEEYTQKSETFEPPVTFSESVEIDREASVGQVTVVKEKDYADSPQKSPYAHLDLRYHGFLTEISVKREWSQSDLQRIARTFGLMLGGTIEAINDWSLEIYEDWLVDDSNDPITVAIELLTSNESKQG